MKRNILLSALFSTLVATALPSAAQETIVPEFKNYGLITPPTCTTDTGERIQYYPGTSEQIVSFGGFLAAAGDFEVGKDGGVVKEKRIYYDESNMPYLPHVMQEFLFRHECSHVTSSQLDIPPSQRLSQYWEIEQSADCEAFAQIKDESSDFPHDADIIKTYFTVVGNEMMKAAPGSEESRKKFLDQRINNMNLCPALTP